MAPILEYVELKKKKKKLKNKGKTFKQKSVRKIFTLSQHICDSIS